MSKIINIAIVMSAGCSTRFNQDLPKQYHKINGKETLLYSIETFLNHASIDFVLPVIAKKDEELFTKTTSNISLNPKLLKYCFGDDHRFKSVKNGLEALKTLNPTNVLIHDSARPFVDSQIITNVINNITPNQGVIPAIKVYDSLKEINKDNIITGDLDREKTVKAQTPQGYDYNSLINCYKFSDELLNDEASLFLKNKNNKILVVDGNILNSKITTFEGYQLFCNIYKNFEYRTGNGFDVHEFAEGRKLILCGVEIPFSKGLLGHSDSDVAMHSITDAILGAISKKDIGTLFPPSEAKWKDAESKIFLLKAKELLEEKNGTITNIDLTIICEEPKISPYSYKMEENIASILKIDKNRINIKATTTEKLGFTGRKEGIAALTTVTIKIEEI